MPLETATHIKDLVVTNPANSDGLNQADDHMRLIKAVLLNDIGDAMTSKSLTTVDGSSAAPSISFASEPTLGLYRKAAGIIGVAGGKLDAEVGSLGMFLVEPSGLGKGAVGTGHRWLELDGSTWPNSAFPALATHLGQGGTTFTLPDAYTTGRFPRSRTATVTAGTVQANQNKAHTHTFTGALSLGSLALTAAGDHYHGASIYDPQHAHTSANLFNGGAGNIGGGGAFGAVLNSSVNAASTGVRVTSANGLDTTATAGSHTHPITGAPGIGTLANASDGGTEARPEALSVVLCIKT